MNNESDRTADNLLRAKRNEQKVLRNFKDGNASVQDLKDAETRTRGAATKRVNYLQKKLRGGSMNIVDGILVLVLVLIAGLTGAVMMRIALNPWWKKDGK